MRIIGGTLKRRALKSPKGDQTRPTTDRVRESLFNILEARFDIEGSRVLDLFAGTGALGLEALSRGAAKASFVESQPTIVRVLKENVKAFGLQKQARVVGMDVFKWLKNTQHEAFDLIFADPPYDLLELPSLIDFSATLLAPDGWFVLEHDARHNFDEHERLLQSRAYGRTLISIFRARG